MDLIYELYDSEWPDAATWQSFLRLQAALFPATTGDAVRARLLARPRFLFQVARAGPTVAGYKIGVEESPARFHSWLGGVAEGHRRRGIASALMDAQHAWCRASGYGHVTTHTTNRWRDMLILNLRHGFEVYGTYTDEHGEVKIMLAKVLGPEGAGVGRPAPGAPRSP